MMNELQLSVSSLAPFAVPGVLHLIGRAFDVDPAFRPSRLDSSDPPRRRVGLVEEALAACERDLCDPRTAHDPYFYAVLERDDVPKLSGAIETGDRDAAIAAGWHDDRARHLTPGGVDICFEREADFRDRPDLLERVCALLIRLCEAADAYTGSVTFESALRRQLRDSYLAASGPVRRTALPVGANIWEREIRRPEWLTFLGPAFVERFGPPKLAALGVERIWTANGGVVVVATATPFAFQSSARAITDYPFLRQWLEVLGRDIFAHDHQVPGAAGQYVPLMAEHVAHTRPPGGDPFDRVGPWGRAAVTAAPAPAASVSTDASVVAEAGPEPGDGVWAELELAAEDGTRVWWEDTEADVQPGGRVYERILAQWAAISRGAFVPRSVGEHWDGDEGPLTITFELDGTEHVLRLPRIDDFIDVDGLLQQLNPLIAHRGVQFVQVDTFDQTAYIMVVDAEERQSLLARGWPLRRV